jgi:hypothetical protein
MEAYIGYPYLICPILAGTGLTLYQGFISNDAMFEQYLVYWLVNEVFPYFNNKLINSYLADKATRGIVTNVYARPNEPSYKHYDELFFVSGTLVDEL